MPTYDSPEVLKAINYIKESNYSAALRELTSPGVSDNPKALCNLANLYHFGWGVSPDGKKAVELYLRVGERNIQDDHLSGLAYNNLATIYMTGLPGIDPDPEKARRYSKQARELGFEM